MGGQRNLCSLLQVLKVCFNHVHKGRHTLYHRVLLCRSAGFMCIASGAVHWYMMQHYLYCIGGSCSYIYCTESKLYRPDHSSYTLYTMVVLPPSCREFASGRFKVCYLTDNGANVRSRPCTEPGALSYRRGGRYLLEPLFPEGGVLWRTHRSPVPDWQNAQPELGSGPVPVVCRPRPCRGGASMLVMRPVLGCRRDSPPE